MKIINYIFLFFFFFLNTLIAGPPFRTDDPVPVDYKHGELYLFSNSTEDTHGFRGVGVGTEFNYGILPNTQFHIIVPFSIDAERDKHSHFGLGDIEVGIKYRFWDETEYIPILGTFPLIELPSGNASLGLGNGKTQIYLPLWLQKDIAKWTIYGGAGFGINSGEGNKNWQFYGILCQYNFSDDFFLGTELIYQTSQSIDGQDNFGLHIGGGVTFIQNYQFIFSLEAGNGLNSYKHFAYYFGIYHTF